MHHPPPIGSLDPTRISLLANPTPSFQSLHKHETEQQQLQPSKRFLWSNHPLGVPPPETHVIIEEFSSPFDYNYDIATDATCKSLRGPTGIILYRRGTKLRKQGMVPNCGDDIGCDFEKKINFALDPTLQGGPHDNHTAALISF